MAIYEHGRVRVSVSVPAFLILLAFSPNFSFAANTTTTLSPFVAPQAPLQTLQVPVLPAPIMPAPLCAGQPAIDKSRIPPRLLEGSPAQDTVSWSATGVSGTWKFGRSLVVQAPEIATDGTSPMIRTSQTNLSFAQQYQCRNANWQLTSESWDGSLAVSLVTNSVDATKGYYLKKNSMFTSTRQISFDNLGIIANTGFALSKIDGVKCRDITPEFPSDEFEEDPADAGPPVAGDPISHSCLTWASADGMLYTGPEQSTKNTSLDRENTKWDPPIEKLGELVAVENRSSDLLMLQSYSRTNGRWELIRRDTSKVGNSFTLRGSGTTISQTSTAYNALNQTLPFPTDIMQLSTLQTDYNSEGIRTRELFTGNTTNPNEATGFEKELRFDAATKNLKSLSVEAEAVGDVSFTWTPAGVPIGPVTAQSIQLYGLLKSKAALYLNTGTWPAVGLVGQP